MTTYRFSNALAYTQPQLAEMHNSSFTGYFFPMHMSAEASAWFWRVYQIDAASSVVMHAEQGAFVGLARVGVRGTRGWCGGFGIAPDFRGTGASKLLAAQMVRVARDNHLTTLQLEVLTQNVKAIKVYEGAGFVAKRRLFGIQIDTAALPQAASAVHVEAVDPAVLLPRLYERPQPDWEREPASILTLGAAAVALPGSDGRLNGLLFQRAGDNIRLLAAFLQNDLSDETLVTLLRAAARDATVIQVFNEPEDSPFLGRCRNLGFMEFFSQHEMFVTL